MENRVGVFLSRMQPLHVGHLGMIDKALSENDKVIILIGSSNKNNIIRNPIGIDLRKEIFEEVIENRYKDKISNITYRELPDWTTEEDTQANLEWGRYLYYNVVSIALKKDFTMYFSDEPEIIEAWFQDDKIRKRINIKTYKRSEMFEDVSSTKIRNAFLNNDKEYIERSVPEEVFKRYDLIRSIINRVYELCRGK
ncbi:MAG: adenylyltransferase/cytidyltransferase family protein [Clostridia bacterium]|nr:adenylyltransferase/cytidyltransferase family protein [Clostridia bacterium]